MGLGWAAAAFFAGWFLSPLLTAPASPGTLDNVAAWALQGSGKDIPTPLMGLYVFRGLNPCFLADMSYARAWNPKERSFIFDMSGPGVHFLDRALPSAMRGEFANTSPTPEVSGRYVQRLMALMRHANKFVMNEEGTRAQIHPIFFFEGFPLNYFARSLIREEIELHRSSVPFGPAMWKRVNYAPPSNATQTDAVYWLHPVATRKPGGAVVVYGPGLRMARRKMVMSNDTSFFHGA
ncbi:hypothetical protein KFE25_008417 [Diacronema lutheri]|uniref:Uncharacterized protein n=1 Tax=Diacronema lutheri TaxID=2081491 RepID=A0A8J5XD59_DIALT|nr:hypothetical protein KFE25_008417 [Diacronema lutheri]|mmetsp:Transcript_15833/g.49268  ORF Transcript_15833/g.49268 Transcript_15833/m.49268 type:complete len:236 (-) Transcript_15833:35-742(-)